MFRTHFTVVLWFLCTFFPVRAKALEDREWWRHAVFYELCPRSFQDTKGTGVGDLNGITARLDYLRGLGVDALWLTPCFPSPQVDFGYDVADYRAIDPRFGTLQDFDRLVAEARRRGIRVVLDLVVNHTSDQHPWFLASRSSRRSPRRDWYVWRDGRGPGRPPCNWLSLFGGSAWTLDPVTGQYYYHYFYRQQPDLNWRNPAVRREMLDVTRWWYQRGVAGFRLDAVDTVFEDPALPDNPLLPGKNAFGDPNMVNRHNYKLQEVHGLLRDLRRAADPYGAVLLGETYTDSIPELQAYYGNGRNELQLPTGHMLAMAETLSAPEFRKRIDALEAMDAWPVWVFGNHDLARAVTRFGDGVHDDAIAKDLAALLLTLRGTPILYYGEELGMASHEPGRREDVVDPMARLGWPSAKRRDGARTPMQWDAGPAAGFTTGTPWLPVPLDAATRNVAVETGDPGSVLNFYRGLTALRRGSRALLEGDYQDLAPADPSLLCYLRRSQDEAVLVAVNLSPEPRKLDLGPALDGWPAARAKLLLGSGASGPEGGLPGELEPYGVVIVALAQEQHPVPAAAAGPAGS